MSLKWPDDYLEAERVIGLRPVRRHGRCVLLFPNSYELGMSNLSVHTLYGLLNRAGVVCERAFLPCDAGYDQVRSLETRLPLGAFDYVLITCSYELDWLNVPRLLERGGIPPLRAERREHNPVIVAGGPAVSANPEPVAAMMDLCWIGEIEPLASQFIQACAEGKSRQDFLGRLEDAGASIEADRQCGVYVPGREEHGSDPGLERQPVHRLFAGDLEASCTESVILTPHTTFADRFLIEVGRGCPHNCRFCLGRQLYDPMRVRSAQMLMRRIEPALEHTGQVGLVGAAVSDHPQINELATELADRGVSLSVSSVRADRVQEPLLAALGRSGQVTLTVAPETGTERLRRQIGKPIRDSDLHRCIELGLAHGIRRYKLYFLVGLPGEEDNDLSAIVHLMESLKASAPEATFVMSISPFVAKPHTPFSEERQLTRAELARRIESVVKPLRKMQIGDVTSGSARWAEVQGVLSRGGRELGEAIVRASAAGGKYSDFKSAVQALGRDWQEYLEPREDAEAERPWQVVQSEPGCKGEA